MDKKTRYKQLKAAGLCVECGKLPAVPNRVHCERCRERHKTANLVYQMRLYYRRQENHECGYCGVKMPPDHYYSCCPKCMEHKKAYGKEYRRRKKDEQVK